MRASKQIDVIGKLNPKITGWANYYRYVSSAFEDVQNAVVFSVLDHIIFLQLKRWAIRRHHNKSLSWIKDMYWHKDTTRNWIFSEKVKDKKGNDKLFAIRNLATTPIVRYTKIRSEANPFDPQYDEYFKQRRDSRRRTRPLKRSA